MPPLEVLAATGHSKPLFFSGLSMAYLWLYYDFAMALLWLCYDFTASTPYV